jgi:putative CocE/NonD family hydrolase
MSKHRHALGVVIVALLPLPAAAQEAAPTKFIQPMTIEFNRRVPMRDGVELSADVYRPQRATPTPVILMRTPYNKASGGKAAVERMQHWVDDGYTMVFMDVRGRGDSDGKFVPWRDDGRDGFDAVEWCAAQPWSNGKIGTLGGSYLGFNQWVTAVEQPPHLACMIPLVTPSDPFVEDPSGVPGPMYLSWYHFTSGRVNQNVEAIDWNKVYQHLPVYTMDEAAGRVLPNWRTVIDHAQLDDWWEPCRYQNKYARVRVPIMHISGWYDDEQIGTPLNFAGMSTQGATAAIRHSQKLLMGPWPHAVNSTTKLGKVDFGASAHIDLEETERHWFDHWLKGKANGVDREPPVRIFVMGANKWRDEQEWPIARTRWTRMYLHSQGNANSLKGDGSLSTSPPSAEPADIYRYDPNNAVPFLTEPSFAQIGGPDDYRPVEARGDVLVYTSDALDQAAEVTGPIRVTLFAASSAPDTDFMAKLIDVWPDGFAQRLCDGMVRARFREGMDKPQLIEPGRVYAYTIDCWNTSQLFKAGHRIRIEITSSAFPKFARNHNTGEPLGKETKVRIADQKVYHDAEHASFVLLPIVPDR